MNYKISAEQIYGIFINPNFKLERTFCEFEEKKIEPKTDIQMTEEYWSAVSDVAVRKRKKEIIYKNRYRIEIPVYNNSDLELIQCSESVLITPSEGNAFYISDIEVKLNNNTDQLFYYNIEYSKDEPNVIVHPLRSDYLFSKANIAKNKISVYKQFPTYQQRASFIYNSAVGIAAFEMEFDLTDLTNFIQVGDALALHSLSYDINLFSVFGFVTCVEKSATKIKFRASGYSGSIDTIYTDLFTLDSINEEVAYQDLINYSAMYFDIYTMLNAKLDLKFKDGDKIDIGNGSELTESIIFDEIAKVPFFLSLSELWKFKFLKTANEIKFYSNNVLLYTANSNNEIAIVNDNEYYDQKEFLLQMPVNNLKLKNV